MSVLPFPDEERVEAAVDAVLRALLGDPHLWKHALRYRQSSNRRLAERLTRLALRAAYLGPGAVVEYESVVGEHARPPPNPNEAHRWCHHCKARRFARYKDFAFRCCVCGYATSPLKKYQVKQQDSSAEEFEFPKETEQSNSRCRTESAS